MFPLIEYLLSIFSFFTIFFGYILYSHMKTAMYIIENYVHAL